jgi:hypothetical protein
LSELRQHRTILCLALFSALELPGVVRAGPPELVVQLATQPTNPGVMGVVYENGGGGILVTTDAGKSWKLLCYSLLFDPVTTKSGSLAITGDGEMLIAAFPGMWHDDGHACYWNSVPDFATKYVAGFALDPIDPNITYAVTSTGGGQMNGIVRRDQTGAWSDFGAKKKAIFTDIFVAPHDGGRRFYVGTAETVPGDAGTSVTNYTVRVSDDDGSTWTDHPFGTADGTWNLRGVDPSNPDRIVASINRSEDRTPPLVTTDSVLVSTDQGANFNEYLTITELGGVAFAPDGRVWIGDSGALDPKLPFGLFHATSLAAPAIKFSNGNYPVQCLGYNQATSTLYACERITFGTVDLADGSFTTELNLTRVSDFVECPGVDMAKTCETQLCGAYCGVGHYAEARVCCAYNTFRCGPAASPGAVCPVVGAGGAGVDAGSGGARDAGRAGDASSRGGTAGDASAVVDSSAVASGGMIGTGGADAVGGAAGSSPGGSEDGGCCSVAGRTRSGASSTAAFALVGALLALRRTKRR